MRSDCVRGIVARQGHVPNDDLQDWREDLGIPHGTPAGAMNCAPTDGHHGATTSQATRLKPDLRRYRDGAVSRCVRRYGVRVGVVIVGTMAVILGAVGAEDVPRYVTERQREAMGGWSTSALTVEGRGSSPCSMESASVSGVARPSVPTDRVATALLSDGETAARISEMILRLEPGVDRERVYEIAQSVARRSRNAGVRAELLCAVIAKESGFNPNARSGTGDHGLCQLHGRPIYGIDANIEAGAGHLAGCIAAQGSEERGLAEYNGGPRGPGMGVCRAYARDVLGKAGLGGAQVPALQRGGGEF